MSTINNAINNASEAGFTVTGGTVNLGNDGSAINIGTGSTGSVIAMGSTNNGSRTTISGHAMFGGSNSVTLEDSDSNLIGMGWQGTIAQDGSGNSVAIGGGFGISGSGINLTSAGATIITTTSYIGLDGSVTYNTNSTVSSSPYIVGATDCMIGITPSGAFSVELPNSPVVGAAYTIFDFSGAAATHNITITVASGGTINDVSSYVLNNAYQSVTVLATGIAAYSVIATDAAPASGGSGITTIDGDSGSATGSTVTLTGSTSGAVFTASGSTVTESFNYLALPTTTSTNGQITINGTPFMHNYGGATCLGDNAGNFGQTGDGHFVAIGTNAMGNNTTGGGYGVAVGEGASYNNTNDFCTSVGYHALYGDSVATYSGGYNTAVGYASLGLVGGANYNTAVGYTSGAAISTGGNNTAIGSAALVAETIGGDNTAIGYAAMQSANGSAYNTAVGYNALNTITTGEFNIAIGQSAGYLNTTSDSANIYIGSLGVSGESHAIRIGYQTGGSTAQQNAAFLCGVNGITVTGSAVLVSSSDQLGVAVSSKRFKDNIQDMGSYSSDILKLRPATFNYTVGDDHSLQGGLIAEEVQEIMPSLVVLDKEGLPQTVKYHDLSVLLLNELQKALKRIDALEAQVKG